MLAAQSDKGFCRHLDLSLLDFLGKARHTNTDIRLAGFHFWDGINELKYALDFTNIMTDESM
jgi:hypothetical protein